MESKLYKYQTSTWLWQF